jgi:hypothetical protein
MELVTNSLEEWTLNPDRLSMMTLAGPFAAADTRETQSSARGTSTTFGPQLSFGEAQKHPSAEHRVLFS